MGFARLQILEACWLLINYSNGVDPTHVLDPTHVFTLWDTATFPATLHWWMCACAYEISRVLLILPAFQHAAQIFEYSLQHSVPRLAGRNGLDRGLTGPGSQVGPGPALLSLSISVSG